MTKRRILIGTLFSGENEFPACIESIARQSVTDVEHLVIRDLPNREAHQLLYREFNNRASRFDLMIKLDADMTFNCDDAIEKIASIFDTNDQLDHLVMAVYDWFSDSNIMGVSAFSPNVHWVESTEDLFVDVRPQFPGRELILWGSPAPVVDHCSNPSPFQAYHFGVHRALKVVQPNRDWSFVAGQARNQWTCLSSVWEHFERVEDKRLGFAVLGAQHVFDGVVGKDHYSYTNSELKNFFENCEMRDKDELLMYLKKTWGTRWSQMSMVLKNVLPRALFGILRRILEIIRIIKRS